MLVNLIRTESSPQGTLGMVLVLNKRFYSMELPWLDNAKGRSCIPYGEYECKIVDSPKFGPSYQVLDVEGRTHILMHVGNWAGDTEFGYKTDSDGCILLGEAIGNLSGQRSITSSRKALEHFLYLTEGAPFDLVISGFDVW